MPLLGPTDPLPFAPQRITVNGTTGSGKSTLARRVGEQLNLPYTELWNGNREAPLRTFFSDPEHIIRWAWSTHPTTAERARDALRRRPELVVVRLTSTAEVESWLGGPAGARSRD